MNCEQVEELLPAYLDAMLAPEERRAVAAHLQTCKRCSEVLADYRRNDTLLKHLPRVSPDAALRERIFSSPEFLELTGESDRSQTSGLPAEWTVPRLPGKYPRRDTPGRPHLVAIPGGRSTAPGPTVKIGAQKPQRQRGRRPHFLMAAIAAALIMAIGAGALLVASTLLHPASAGNTSGITPPASGPQTGPLSAGVRFVFLRDGALWSELADGSRPQPERLTPQSVTVSTHWAVSTSLPGQTAGDMLAYIDLQKGFVHIIRSDGQEDTSINQRLVKAGVLPATVWDTDTGATILSSLAWSPDGNKLAFVGDPNGTGQTHLYLYSKVAGVVTQIPVAAPGSVSTPTWSPDGARLAFEVSQSSATSILDYNVQNHGTLTVASGIGSGATAGQSVLTLDWAPDAAIPAITWSTGTIGHIRSLWVHHVGVDGNAGAQQILAGDFAEATYSRTGHGGAGSWLVITTIAGRAGDIWRIDVTPGAPFIQLSRGKQVNFAEWSPDGASIGYLDTVSQGVGTFHIINASTAIDMTVSSSVTYDPAPVWSQDNSQVAFSTGTRIGVVGTRAASSPHYLALRGAASALVWSVASPDRLIAAISDVQQGIYLVDTQHNSTTHMDKLGADGPILWTQIP